MIYVNTEEIKLNGQVAEKAQEKKMLWDEENRLGAISINGYVSSYSYDAGGERVTKLSGGGQGIFVNSVFSGGKTSTSDFTLYVNPYLVAQNGGRYTKHIYIGSQRIVSKLGDFDSYGADPRHVEKAGESFSGVKVNYDAKYKKALEVVKENYTTLDVPYYGTDNNDYVNGLGFCCNPYGENNSSSTTGKMTAKNDNAELQQFYYHPDHLGSSSYISNLDGEVVQHIEYVPFGEVFLEEKNAKWNTPYLFTSKELDRETGLYYFGARYQDPKLGIFISVDPLAHRALNWSPYAYTLNNPINMVDPDGKFPILVNGKVGGDSERASYSYWNSKVRSTISNQTGYSQSSFKYVDGDQGFWASTRIKAGLAKGKSDAASIYARMKKTMKNGKIIEQLQFITHSRGGAFGKGYMDGVSAEIANLAKKEGVEFAYGAGNIIEYSVNLAPHQSNSIDYNDNGSKNVNMSHVGDSLSGDDATGNVVNAESDAETSNFDQHGNGTYNTELNFILKILKSNTKKSNLPKEIKAGYKNYDNNRTNGGKAIITEGSN